MILENCEPCVVDGRKALFHRWVDEEKLVVQFDSFIMPDKAKIVMDRYNEQGYLPCTANTKTISFTYGLVSFEDGHVEKVEPTSIVFIDSTKIFESYCWPEEL